MAQPPNKKIDPLVVGYDFTDTVPLPGDIGVHDGESIEQLIDNIKGINHYLDYIAFGQKSLFNTRDVNRPGLRRFVGTGIACPNGAEMNIYYDSTVKGNILGERIKRGLVSAGLPPPMGMAPGILEDARDALNPLPLLSAAMATGFPDCELQTKPVGDLYGNTQPADQDPKNPKTWIEGDLDAGWPPRQTKWVHKLDRNNSEIWLTENEFNLVPKTLNFDGSKKKLIQVKEGFSTASQQANVASKLAAIAVLIALASTFIFLK